MLGSAGIRSFRFHSLLRKTSTLRTSAGRLVPNRITCISLEGKTVLVTGSTDGIGRHTSTRLAAEGATVLLHGRDKPRVQQIVEHIRTSTGNSSVHGYTADLSSLGQVWQLAEGVAQDHLTINVLINNAGVFEQQKRLSDDGFEMTWAVNVLAPFLLTSLLLDKVTERIVNVSSISAGSSIDFNNLNAERSFSSHGTYSLSKLAMILYTYQLAECLKDTGITANCLDPGTVNTKMLRAGWGSFGLNIKDANDEFYLATHPSLAKTTGSYFVSRYSQASPSISYDKKVQQRLWQVLEQQTGAHHDLSRISATTGDP